MKKLTAILVMCLFSMSVFAGWNAIETGGADWNITQFTADTTTVSPDQLYDLAVSDVISNNADADNLDVVISFDEILPGGSVSGVSASYRLFIVVEEEIATGVWNSIADSTQQLFRDMPNGPTEAKFIIQKNSTADQGQPFNTLNGFKWFVNGAPSEKLRVRLFFEEMTPGGTAALQSVKVTGVYRLY